MKNKGTYIIAEIGNTHEGSVGLAKKFIEAASKTGVDAVKFQTHIFEAESLPSAPNPKYFKDESRKEYFERTSFNIEQWKELKRYAEEECKLDFFSSPFSIEAVNLLEKIGVSTYKIASGEVSNRPLLEHIAKLNKRVIISSGMSTFQELDEAISIFPDPANLILLQCTSEYPCPPEKSGLNVIDEMKKRFPQLTIGYSDHTLGNAIPLAAIVKGAKVIEKHFTLSKLMYGSDAFNSTEPKEFYNLVKEIRELDTALSHHIDKDSLSEDLNEMRMIFQKSIVYKCNLKIGEKIVMNDLAFKKPGTGVPAKDYNQYIGKKLSKNVFKNELLNKNDFV